MRSLALAIILTSGIASAQTLPLRLPQFVDPPASNGADAILYPNGILYNPTLGCIAGAVSGAWPCLATRADVAATYATQASVSTVSSSVTSNTSSITSLNTRVTTLESQVATAQGTATAAQTASSTNAAAIAALDTRVTAVEAAMAALQALPKRLCASFTVAGGLTVPLAGISTAINVPLPGVPVGAVCDTGAPTRPPLGARPDPQVSTAGTVNMVWVSNAAILSGVLSIPSGTYKVCCDSF